MHAMRLFLPAGAFRSMGGNLKKEGTLALLQPKYGLILIGPSLRKDGMVSNGPFL